jgi:hypothetical protein
MPFVQDLSYLALLALAAEAYVSIGILLAGLSVVGFFFYWYLLNTSKVFDGLKKYEIQVCDFGKLQVIKENCKVNELTMREKLSCYHEGQMMVLCHHPLPFGIARRCWRIPVAEMKPRDDAVYDFALATPKGPLLCYFGKDFRKQFKLFEGTQPRENAPLGSTPSAVSIGPRDHQ